MKKSLLLLSLLAGAANAQQAPTKTFASPNGLTEECRILPHMPGGKYSDKDAKTEEEYCGYDFYDTTKVALCAKTWSTSPGTMVADISKSGKSQRDYEAQATCGTVRDNPDFQAKFKYSINHGKVPPIPGTSGTFSPSSLMYYELSRYFDADVTVPVAVYRTMDKQAHMDRVSKKTMDLNRGQSSLNKGGWYWLYHAEANPTSYSPTSELFTDSNKQIYGVIVGSGGDRYGTEVNGMRGGAGDGQYADLQKTAPFTALRSQKPLKDAIVDGLAAARKVGQMNADLGKDVSDLQMAVWMKELSEIAIFDYIFSQQDRPGNIDFKWYQYTVGADGKVSSDRVKVKTQRKGTAIVDGLIQRTQLTDNDAGGRPYVNSSKNTESVKNLRHLGPDTYTKVQALNADFQAKGELYQYFSTQFNITQKQLDLIVSLTKEVADTLKATCLAGQLRFDLFGPKAILRGKNQEVQLSCDSVVAQASSEETKSAQ